jgi:hypothetical protein
LSFGKLREKEQNRHTKKETRRTDFHGGNLPLFLKDRPLLSLS